MCDILDSQTRNKGHKSLICWDLGMTNWTFPFSWS